jgi:hypothetical protein
MEGDSRRIIILVVVALVCIACLCVCCVTLGVGAEVYSRRLVAGTPTLPTPRMRLPGPRVTPGGPSGAVATEPAAPPAVAPGLPGTAAPPPSDAAAGGSLSPEEQAYVAGFEDQSQRWADSRQKFDTLMAAPNPADAGWKNDVTAQFSAWQGLASQAGGLPAAPRFSTAQQKYSQAAQHFAAAALLGADSLARQDTVAFDRAKSEIAAGDTALNEARAQVAASKK